MMMEYRLKMQGHKIWLSHHLKVYFIICYQGYTCGVFRTGIDKYIILLIFIVLCCSEKSQIMDAIRVTG